MAEHARFSASASHRWMTCPASLKLSEQYPDTPSPAAEEGTVAHNEAEKMLLGKGDSQNPFVRDYVEFCKALPGTHHVEVRVDFSMYVPDGFGTADFIAVYDDTIHIVDLKYGKGVPVYAENNPQAMLYALGAYHLYEWLYDFKRVITTIYQPRINNVNTHEFSIEDLIEFGQTVSVAASKCLEDEPEFNPGEKQCQFCRHQHNCTALRDQLISNLPFDVESEPPAISSLTDEQKRGILDAAPMIKKFIAAIEKEAVERIAGGGTFPGYKMVAGRSSRKWVDEANTIQMLEGYFSNPSDMFEPQELLSPAKMEKLVGKDKIYDLVKISTGKPTLVPETDKREPLAVIDSDMFDDLD